MLAHCSQTFPWPFFVDHLKNLFTILGAGWILVCATYVVLWLLVRSGFSTTECHRYVAHSVSGIRILAFWINGRIHFHDGMEVVAFLFFTIFAAFMLVLNRSSSISNFVDLPQNTGMVVELLLGLIGNYFGFVGAIACTARRKQWKSSDDLLE